MDVTYGELSSAGSVRPHNEDTVLFWQPADADQRRTRGVIAILADGVGGQGYGEVASQLAAQTALKTFQDAPPDTPLSGLLWKMFNDANLAVYDRGMTQRATAEGRMATTLTIAVFRNNEVGVGHVGDSRAYLVQAGKIRQLTTDHTHLAFHVKMGLFSPVEAQNSPLRSVLTRAVGKEPTINMDFQYSVVYPGDFVIQCCDGIHVHLTERELMELATRKAPADACADVLALAQRRGTDDNISVQICRVDKVHQLTFYRGNPIYTKPAPETAPGELGVGQVLDGRFAITALISRSGMASIFKARDESTGQEVALKVPFMQFESDAAFYSRFEREETIGRTLSHPNILHVLPVEKETKSRPYIVMELLDGETLDQVMARERPMEMGRAIRVTAEICAALAYMHGQNIVHRDLKPQNIMICKDGSLRIMDFGIAKAAGMRRITFTGFSPAMGTPDYMAPEQVKGRRGDERTDVYSLGAMFYEMATGAVPFEGANPFLIMNARLTGDPKAPRRLNPTLPPQIEEIILHAMARDPAQRYQKAADFKADLDHPDQVTLTGRATRLEVPAQWKSKWRAVRLTLITIVAIVAVIVLVVALGGGQRPHRGPAIRIETPPR